MPGKDLVPRPAVLPPAVSRPPWQPDDKKEFVPAYRWLWQRRHWTVPAFVVPALWLAGLGAHLLHLSTYIIVAGAPAIMILGVFAPQKWDRRGEQIYAVASVTAALIWLWFAASRSLMSPWLDGALLLLVTVWGAFWYRHKRPRGHRRRQKLISKWDLWWQSNCWHWNLGGSKVIGVWLMGVTTKVRIQGIAGRHSIQHIRQVMHLIESGADGHADIGMVRAEPVKGHPAQFDLFFKKENPLRQIVDLDLSLLPRSVHEPAPAGISETGSWKMLSLRVNCFVIGATRSGKSNHLLVRLASLTGCADDWQILIDLKGGRSARPVLEAGAVAYVVTEVDEARMLELMLVAEGSARQKYAYTGHEQLLASRECPSLHVLIDEVHGLTSVANGDSECAAKLGLITSQGSNVEIYTEVYTQHGSLEESVRTEQTRANLACRIAYRVTEARHAAYAIPEYAKLDASKLEEKGTCYIKDGPEALAEQVRAPYMPHSLLKKIAAQNAAALGTRPPLRLYCGAEMSPAGVTWQQWWDSRWARLDPAFREISPQYQAYAAMMASSSPAQAFAAAAPAREMAAAAGAPLPSEPGEGDAASAAERIRRELEQTYSGVMEGAIRPNRNLGAVLSQNKEQFAEALTSAPSGGISPKELIAESGMSPPWVHQKLALLQEAQAVTKLGRGRYAAVPGADVREAMAALDAAGERLFREAVAVTERESSLRLVKGGRAGA
jgi:hypothetical protein